MTLDGRAWQDYRTSTLESVTDRRIRKLADQWEAQAAKAEQVGRLACRSIRRQDVNGDV